MKRLAWTLVICLVLSTLAVAVVAKGVADRIRITGPGLEDGVDITDAKSLERLNPWAGHFLGTGGPLEYAPFVGQRLPYDVKFFVVDSGDEQVLRYFFFYYPNSAGGRGLIYMPGPDEPYYSINAGTIKRGKADGRWCYASPGWDQLISGVLAEQGLTAGDAQARPFSTGWVILPAGALLVAVIIFGIGRLRKDGCTACQAGS